MAKLIHVFEKKNCDRFDNTIVLAVDYDNRTQEVELHEIASFNAVHNLYTDLGDCLPEDQINALIDSVNWAEKYADIEVIEEPSLFEKMQVFNPLNKAI